MFIFTIKNIYAIEFYSMYMQYGYKTNHIVSIDTHLLFSIHVILIERTNIFWKSEHCRFFLD